MLPSGLFEFSGEFEASIGPRVSAGESHPLVGVLEEQGSHGSTRTCASRQDDPARDDIAGCEVLPNHTGERARRGYLPSRFSKNFKWA